MDRNFRWFIIFLVFLITLINMFDRSSISFTIKLMQNELGFTHANFGILLAGFGIGYSASLSFIGILVDRFSPKVLWPVLAGVWSLSTFLLAFAESFETILFLRIILGAAEAGHFPLVTRVISDWLPIKERSRALAWVLVAVPFSSLIGAPIITHVTYFLGWRGLFACLGAAGFIWIPFWFIYFRDRPEQSEKVSPKELGKILGESKIEASSKKSAKEKEPTWTFLKNLIIHPVYLSNCFAVFVFGYMLFFAHTWMPNYLEVSQGLNIKELGYLLTIPWLLAGV